MSKPDVTSSAQSSEPLPPPDWERWRQYGMAMMRHAALLSLNVEPTTPSILATLENHYPALYKSYLRRCNVFYKNCGHHPLIPRKKHPNDEKSKYGKVLRLPELCAFLVEKKLASAEMVAAVAPDLLEKSRRQYLESSIPTTPSGGQSSSTEEEDLPHKSMVVQQGVRFEDLKKGERYLAHTLGALVLLLEDALKNPTAATKKYLRGERMAYARLGLEVKSVFVEQGVNTFEDDLHTAQTIARNISAAVRLVDPKKG